VSAAGGAVVLVGPATRYEVVHLATSPAPRPHSTYARSHLETVGGTSAGEVLHLQQLGRPAVLHTLIG